MVKTEADSGDVTEGPRDDKTTTGVAVVILQLVSSCSKLLKTRVIKLRTSGYATLFMAGGAICIAHYDVIVDIITRKL